MRERASDLGERYDSMACAIASRAVLIVPLRPIDAVYAGSTNATRAHAPRPAYVFLCLPSGSVSTE